MKKILFLVVCCLCLCGCGKESKENVFYNPNIKEINSKISQISEISNSCIVTEENDPNGQLNKQGGYSGALYFTHKNIDNSEEETLDACEIGTDGGGSIEVYINEKDAKKRNEYLTSFDGGILADFHQIKGTVVIRISNKLSASNQQKLYDEIIESIENTI